MTTAGIVTDGGGSTGDVLVSDAVRRATRTLARAGVPSPRVDAEILLAHAAGVPRAEVVRAGALGARLADLADPATRPEAGGADLGEAGGAGLAGGARLAGVAGFADLVERRARREPLQHLTGVAPFRNLELAVGPGVFVPRPETEVVAQVAIDAARAALAARGEALVVDLCTGSGAIALAVATEVPQAQVIAVELDAAAFDWARRNVTAVTAGTRASVRLVRGDARRALRGPAAAGGLDGGCDVVVSNPPYVPADAVPVDPEVAAHDPAVALYGLGADGFEVPRGIVAAGARLLRPGGLFVMEHAEVQAAVARAAVTAIGAFGPAETRPDLAGRPRMVVARRCGAGGDAAVKDWKP